MDYLPTWYETGTGTAYRYQVRLWPPPSLSIFRRLAVAPFYSSFRQWRADVEDVVNGLTNSNWSFCAKEMRTRRTPKLYFSFDRLYKQTRRCHSLSLQWSYLLSLLSKAKMTTPLPSQWRSLERQWLNKIIIKYLTQKLNYFALGTRSFSLTRRFWYLCQPDLSLAPMMWCSWMEIEKNGAARKSIGHELIPVGARIRDHVDILLQTQKPRGFWRRHQRAMQPSSTKGAPNNNLNSKLG